MKTIVCFGDSNTYGSNPNPPYGRWSRSERWTGRLQQLLGEEYYVIEEGYGGRTTAFADRRDIYRSGIDAVVPVMKSHSPVDLVVVMLGTNDLQVQFSATPRVSAKCLRAVVEEIYNYCRNAGYEIPKVLIVSPIHIAQTIDNGRYWTYDISSHKKSLCLAEVYKQTAEELRVDFFDAASVAEPGPDSLHMDAEGHKNLAEALAGRIRHILI